VFRGLRIDQVRGLLEKIKINFAGVLNNATFAVPTKKGVWGCVCVCVLLLGENTKSSRRDAKSDTR